MEAVKPAVLIWVQPKALLRMSQGIKPGTWYTDKPASGSTSAEYVQALIPHDTFAELWEEKEQLDSQTNDLPF